MKPILKICRWLMKLYSLLNKSRQIEIGSQAMCFQFHYQYLVVLVFINSCKICIEWSNLRWAPVSYWACKYSVCRFVWGFVKSGLVKVFLCKIIWYVYTTYQHFIVYDVLYRFVLVAIFVLDHPPLLLRVFVLFIPLHFMQCIRPCICKFHMWAFGGKNRLLSIFSWCV